ncbi:MAG: HAD-IB family phosphatase [Chitinivibrionales bacterium]|nr:HAD-IB family phosphatase [Chitinivibrionales bacterium]
MKPPPALVVFDLDGTLTSEYSAELTLFKHLFKSGFITRWNIAQLALGVWHKENRLTNIFLGNKRYLRNKREEELHFLISEFFKPHIKQIVFKRMRRRIDEHRQQNQVLTIISASLQPIVDCFVNELGLDAGLGCGLQKRNGHLTGNLAGVAPYSKGKVVALHDLRRKLKIPAATPLICYGNQYADRHILHCAHEAVCVKPTRKLRKLALKKNWRIIENPHRE